MKTKVNTLDFSGQMIYAGIDTHKKAFKVTVLGENLSLKTFSQPAEARVLAEYLKRNYPGASYCTAYEAGFSGFWLKEQLEANGINCMVVNASDIPTTDKDKKRKQDKRDSRKIAKFLRSGNLEAIYVPSKECQLDRALLRTRYKLQGNLTRSKNRVKSMLYFLGIKWPEEFENQRGYWSKRFIKWLETIDLGRHSGNMALKSYLDEAEFLRKLLLGVYREIRQLSKSQRYNKEFKILISVPGIGPLSAMTLLTELEDVTRFVSFNQLCSYVGIIPNMYASGEKENTGQMTKRGNVYIKKVLIESAWVAARQDPALTMTFNKLCRTMKANKAIVRIARKLLRRINHILVHQTEYQLSIVS
jgi:transposase